MLTGLAVAICLALAPDAAAPQTRSFRTDVSPRVDPVFGSVPSLRSAVDQFLALQTEMDRVREEFGITVHRTLALLPPGPDRRCPTNVPVSYAQALDAGRRFLSLGRRLEARFQDIRRSEELGDTAGLTPDYRLKVKRSRELYATLLRDYREMRAAFHDQLRAELRHAGCKLDPTATRSPGPAPAGAPDPANPADWELAPTSEAAAPAAGAAARPRPEGEGAGPAIWIHIDNTRCAEVSKLTLDGVPVGEIAAGKKTSVRTRAGPHALCVLPASDPRVCGAAGTVRRAYLYEGWSLAVRCGR